MDENYKSLKDVVKYAYIIGSYQRGYRWDEVNVRELLEDIFEDKLVESYSFPETTYLDENEVIVELKKNIRATEYCLQPLVLKKEGSGYSVIDGQQRLTTLYIILKALCSVSDKKFPADFSIEYKSRDTSKDFLQGLCDISEDANIDNIDSAYILQAYKFAKKWFLDRNRAFIALLDSNYVECDENKMIGAFATYLYSLLLTKTKFIWDEIDESSADMNKKEQKIFADRNTGRLELTDSELIKSLFMNPEYYGKNTVNLKDRQTLISEIWDIYENELHNEELWEFLPISNLAREKYSLLTRIDAIFLLLIKKNNIAMNPYEENALFKAVKMWLDEAVQSAGNCMDEERTRVMAAAWREVCDLFDGIKELFDHNEIYNLLSLYKMTEPDPDHALRKYMEALEEPRNKRTELIKASISGCLFDGEISKCVKRVRFPDRALIRKILVAHNVAITNSSNPVNRFGFHFFNEIKGKWDIEHIYSTNEGYIAKAALKEKVRLLQIFSEQNNNVYKQYIETLYSVNIDGLQGEMEDKDFIDFCFKASKARYDMYFDIWRYLKLKEYARDLLFKYNISSVISGVLKSKNFDIEANDFFHDGEYDDQEVFMLLRSEFLYWDKDIEDAYVKIRESGQTQEHITWHGYDVKISDPSVFWGDSGEEKNIRSNFLRNYYRELLSIIYDNTGISAQDISFGNHGKKKEQIIDDDSREKVRAFLKGTKERIEESIQLFFIKDESIDPEDDRLGQQADYNTLAAFVNDNSMGNMMLLPVEINRAGKYRDVNFSGKRKFVVDKGNVFLPVATSNVLMGKYIDLETSTEQWLMNERREYLNDMIHTMSAYYGKE